MFLKIIHRLILKTRIITTASVAAKYRNSETNPHTNEQRFPMNNDIHLYLCVSLFGIVRIALMVIIGYVRCGK